MFKALGSIPSTEKQIAFNNEIDLTQKSRLTDLEKKEKENQILQSWAGHMSLAL